MKISKSELELVGAAIYICEGTKIRTDNRGYKIRAVEFTNKDPRVIKMFLNFLRRVIGAVEFRIKAELFIYPDHNEQELVRYWSEVTDIPVNRFNKSILLRQKNIKCKPNILGTIKIRYCHKEHFLKIQDIIESVFGRVA